MTRKVCCVPSGWSRQDQPFAQYGRQAVAPPSGVREEWEFFTDLCLAMKVPLFGYRGVNGFIKASRRLARLTKRPALAFRAEWIDALLVAIRAPAGVPDAEERITLDSLC